MYLYQTDSGWTVQAPAKLNLFFEVYGKRTDGFHEISSLALPIRLFDTLTFQSNENGIIDFDCAGGSDDVPTDQANIVVRSLSLLKKRTGTDRGATVRLFKRIPSQAGLGGGSSDAAAAILAANKAWNLSLSRQEMSDLGAEIGSDLPIFFQQGASLSQGRGEKTETVDGVPQLYFILLKPKEGLSTAEVYGQCMKSHDGRLRSIETMLSLLKTASVQEIGQGFYNRLEDPAAVIWPNFERTKTLLEQAGCLAVRMSGSGTAFYGLCRNRRHADQLAARLRQMLRNNEKVFSVAGF